MNYHFSEVPAPYVVAGGRSGCGDGHVGSQLIQYNSPAGSHYIWSCPKCHRIVRQDVPNRSKAVGWTNPEVHVPKGLEGVETGCGRAWKMPNAVDTRPWWRKS